MEGPAVVGRRRVEETFSLCRVVSQYEKLYRTLTRTADRPDAVGARD